MSINMNIAIENMERLKQRGITYSMNGSRDGSDGTGDCSGTVVSSIYKAGASKPAYLYNTDSMHSWLVANGFELIATNKEWQMERGDVIIFGRKGASGGAAGHVVLAYDKTNVIDCAWYGSTSVPAVRIRNENQLPYSMGWYVYRYKGGVSKPSNTQKPSTPTQSTNLVWYKENGTFQSSEAIWLRTEPSTKTGRGIALMPVNTKIKYDQFTYNEGYIWIRQPRPNGQYAYMATGLGSNLKRQTSWGRFY